MIKKITKTYMATLCDVCKKEFNYSDQNHYRSESYDYCEEHQYMWESFRREKWLKQKDREIKIERR